MNLSQDQSGTSSIREPDAEVPLLKKNAIFALTLLYLGFFAVFFALGLSLGLWFNGGSQHAGIEFIQPTRFPVNKITP